MRWDLTLLVDLARRLLFNMLARDFDFDNMGVELRRELRRIGITPGLDGQSVVIVRIIGRRVGCETLRGSIFPLPAKRPWYSIRASFPRVPGLSLPYQLRISRTRGTASSSFVLPPGAAHGSLPCQYGRAHCSTRYPPVWRGVPWLINLVCRGGTRGVLTACGTEMLTQG